MKRKLGVSLIAIMLLVISTVADAADNGIIVMDAWMPTAPPNAKVIAGYMTIKNKASKALMLTNVSSDSFKKIEIHETIMNGDIMRMRPREKLEIPASDVVHLQPGSYHLMLIGPVSVPKEGDEVQVTLHFSRGLPININLTVHDPNSKVTNRQHL